MPKINRYVDIDQVEKEAKKDYIDRHSPFIHCEGSAKAGTPLSVTVQMGKEYAHPDDPEHFIQSISLYNGDTMLGSATFVSGMLGGQGAKGNARITFSVLPAGGKMKLTAQSYCTKHGIWESDPVEVTVEG